MEIQFDPTLDAIAYVTKALFPSGNGRAEVLRLLVDYKDPDGTDRNMDTLATISRSVTTAQLIKRVRTDLAPGYKLSAISSVDYGRPIYIAPSFLEECMKEQGLPIPDDVGAAMRACGLQLLTLEEIRQMKRRAFANE